MSWFSWSPVACICLKKGSFHNSCPGYCSVLMDTLSMLALCSEWPLYMLQLSGQGGEKSQPTGGSDPWPLGCTGCLWMWKVVSQGHLFPAYPMLAQEASLQVWLSGSVGPVYCNTNVTLLRPQIRVLTYTKHVESLKDPLTSPFLPQMPSQQYLLHLSYDLILQAPHDHKL